MCYARAARCVIAASTIESDVPTKAGTTRAKNRAYTQMTQNMP